MPSTQTVDDPTGNGWQQPPFDPRITNLSLLQQNPLSTKAGIERGFIKQAAGNAAGSANQTTTAQGFLTAPRTVYFLYNPSSVNVSHSINTSDATLDPSLRATQLDDGTLLAAPTGATVSFSLLFDRTYEVSNPANFNTRVGEKGVAVDIEALYALTGILQLQNATTSLPSPLLPQVSGADNAGKAETIAKQLVAELNQGNIAGFDTVFTIQDILAGTSKSPSGSPETSADAAAKKELEKRLRSAGLALTDLPPNPDQTNVVDPNAVNANSIFAGSAPGGQQRFGYMTMQPVVVVFGRQRVTWSPTVEYYGYISGMEIEYAHWTQNMVPSRCAVSITLTQLGATVDQMVQMATWAGP